MKNIINFLLTGLILLTMVGCGFDNYDEPTSKLTGKITYNGQALQLRGTANAVQLQIYQDGYAMFSPITATVTQDGSYSVILFDGTYKMVTRDNNGPWVNTRDTSIVTVKGNTIYDLSVTPYFTISNANMSLSGSTVNATFTINQIVETANIQTVYLLVSRTQFCDEVYYEYRRDFTDQSPGQITIDGDFSAIYAAVNSPTLYGRVGVRSNQTAEAIFSDVIKLR